MIRRPVETFRAPSLLSNLLPGVLIASMLMGCPERDYDPNSFDFGLDAEDDGTIDLGGDVTFDGSGDAGEDAAADVGGDAADDAGDLDEDAAQDAAGDLGDGGGDDASADASDTEAADSTDLSDADGAPDDADGGDGDTGDAGAEDGGEPDASADADASADGGDDAGTDAGTGGACPAVPLPTVGASGCAITEGSNDLVVLRGLVLAPGEVLEQGEVVFNGSVANAPLLCVDCDCSSVAGRANATVVWCPEAVISPGLINHHDHITFDRLFPRGHGDERYDHRHDWREGIRSHTELRTPGDSSNNAVWWGELRHLMGGTTSMVGSGGADNLVRNLDRDQEGLGQGVVNNSTFPLGDSGGTLRASGCSYPEIVFRSTILDDDSFLPHISEGIDREARNEFLCTSSDEGGGEDLIEPITGVIHAIGLNAADLTLMSTEQAKIVWSPRSNIDLYGNTAQVSMFHAIGGIIALGTDWTPSGSINLLRELRCADSFNRDHLDGYFSDEQLVRMATDWAAEVTGTAEVLGALRAGYMSDIAMFRHNPGLANPYRAIIEADPEDVMLVLRGGLPVYGDRPVVDALLPSLTGCEVITVCDVPKRLCLQREIGATLETLEDRFTTGELYPLTFCDGPPDLEPSCEPFRPGEYDGVTANDRDGDGVRNAVDNCPDVFNPVRPVDGSEQADFDGDDLGDVCDPCPLAPDTTDCPVANPDDRDGDGRPNLSDNCPNVSNADQADFDGDDIGDVCDACPEVFAPSGACPFTVAQVRDPEVVGGPELGERVLFEELVVTVIQTTRANNFGFYAQDPGAPDYGGIFVYTRNATPRAADGTLIVPGMRVVEGEVIEFSGITEVDDPATVEIVSTGTVPAPRVVSPDAMDESLEGLFVEVRDVFVRGYLQAPPTGAGNEDEFWVAASDSATCTGDSPPCALVGDFVYDGGDSANNLPAAAIGDEFSAVRGVVNGFGDRYSIDIRTLDDLVE